MQGRPSMRKAEAKATARRDAAPEPSSLSDALFSGTPRRVLGLLFGQPHRSYFATELIDLVGAGSGAVQRELQRLKASGLVTSSRQGNQKHFKANESAPIFPELRSVVLKTVGLAEPLRVALEPLEQQLKLAVVYGSVAKGTDTALSDIDLLIVADKLILEEVYRALAPVEKSLARRINPTLYTAEEFRQRRSSEESFLSKVLTGDHIVLAGDERDLTAAR